MKVKPRERVVLYGLKEIHQADSIFILILASLREMALGFEGLLGAVYPQLIVNDLIAPRILFVKFSWADGALQLDIAIRVSPLARPV